MGCQTVFIGFCFLFDRFLIVFTFYKFVDDVIVLIVVCWLSVGCLFVTCFYFCLYWLFVGYLVVVC